MVKSTRGALPALLLAASAGAAAIVSNAEAMAQSPGAQISARVTASAIVARARIGSPISVEDLAALVEVGDNGARVALSPTGAQLAFMERRIDLTANRIRHTVRVIPLRLANGALRAGAPETIGDGGGPAPVSRDGRLSGVAASRVVLWSPDSRWVYYLAQHEGRVELWRSAADSTASERIAGAEADVRGFAWNEDQSALVFETLTPRAELARHEDMARRYGRRVDERFEPAYALAFKPDEEAGRRVWRHDPLTGAVSSAGDADARALGRRSLPDGARAEAETDPAQAGVFRPTRRVVLISADGVRTPCIHPVCNGAVAEAWRVGEDDVYFQRAGERASATEIYRWTPSSGAVRRVRVSEERLVGCVLARRALICFADAPPQPRRLVAIDLASGAANALYDPNPQWAEMALPRIDRLDVIDSDGNRSFAHLVYPLNWRPGRPMPLVVVQYRSRGFLAGGTGGEYPILPFSARGYGVLSVDRPEVERLAQSLSSVETQRLTELSGEEIAIKTAAIDAMLAYLERTRRLRSDRVALTGMSDGAETVYALIAGPRHYAAAVVSTPPGDPASWALMSGAHRRFLSTVMGVTPPWTDPPDAWSGWWARAPSLNAERYAVPILFNMPQSEIMFALPLVARLEAMGSPYDLYFYPGAFHAKSAPLQVLSAQRRALAWVDLWLSDIDTYDETEPDRALRWRAMRAQH